MQKGHHPVQKQEPYVTDSIVKWIGSLNSIVFHSTVFAAFLVLTLTFASSRDLILLVWNTIVSLEAIYLAIFIQMTVNRHTAELEEVSEDIDEIQEDVGEIQKDIDEVQEDVEDIQEDDVKDAVRRKEQVRALGELTQDVRRLLTDLETFRSANGFVRKQKVAPAAPQNGAAGEVAK
ncbi:MAG: DUF1003 domain-containing protein [Patescibacteria group bacterium]|nr:DUF1003 domain-containing protein [Patescibacteria group bacterium]